MQKFLIPALAALLCSMVTPVLAADSLTKGSIEDALNSEEGRKLVASDIKLHFGNERVKVAQVIGEWKSNRRRNMSHESSQAIACHVAFANAAYELQKRARAEGGDAVINIVSVDNTKAESASRTAYTCRVGRVMAAVALQGKVVKTRK